MSAVSAPAAPAHRLAVLAIILVSYLMIVLDISIVITALPEIQRTLALSTANLSWVQNAYTLSFGGLLLLGARAGDILGRRRMFVTGLVIFTIASLLVGAAPSAMGLFAARVLQGVGAAILAPSTLALLQTNFAEGPERTRAIGYYGATAGVGASIGLVLGGLIADVLSWRVGFFINLPVGVLLMFGARRYLAETERRPGRFDVAGALSSTLGMTALVYGLVRAAAAGWGDALAAGALIAGTLLLALFVFNESRAQQPIMPLRLFASRERAAAYAARVFFLGGMVGFWFFSTQYLQGVLGFRPFEAGLAFLPATLANFVAAMAVPRVTQRYGNARVLAGGLLVSVIGVAWLSRAGVDASYTIAVALPMMLIGSGQGGTLSPLTIAGVAGVSRADAGAASGLVNVAHQLGGSLGLGILVVVAAHAGSTAPEDAVMLAHRIGAALTAAAAMLLVALLLVLRFIVQPRHRPVLASEPG